jgi:hypothetical protein
MTPIVTLDTSRIKRERYFLQAGQLLMEGQGEH